MIKIKKIQFFENFFWSFLRDLPGSFPPNILGLEVQRVHEVSIRPRNVKIDVIQSLSDTIPKSVISQFLAIRPKKQLLILDRLERRPDVVAPGPWIALLAPQPIPVIMGPFMPFVLHNEPLPGHNPVNPRLNSLIVQVVTPYTRNPKFFIFGPVFDTEPKSALFGGKALDVSPLEVEWVL